MKKLLLLVVITFFGWTTAQKSEFVNTDKTTTALALPNPMYAKPGGTGDGSSWEKAKDLVSIMTLLYDNRNAPSWSASAPMKVWVAKGSYIPSNQYGGGNQRDRTFVLVKNVQLFGGFVGDETNINARKPLVNETFLVGNNISAHVVVSNGDVGNALIDGFTIKDGVAKYAESMSINGIEINHQYGGGMYINNSSPVIRNSIFRTNSANQRGAGAYIANKAKPIFQNVVFRSNIAGADNGDGGAIYLDNNNTKLTLLNCTISVNSANDGGALRINDNTDVVIYNTIIYDNTSAKANGTVNAEISLNFKEADFVARNGNNIKNNIFQYFDKGINNVRVDPKFVSANFMLTSTSPAIDAGDNSLYLQPGNIEKLWIDAAGQNRLIKSRIDIGAWEMQCSINPPVGDNTTYRFCTAGKVSDLITKINTTGTVKVYASATAYDELATTMALVNNATYYVKKTDSNGCESYRVRVNVILETVAAPMIISTAGSICQGSYTLGNIKVEPAINTRWYSSATSTTVLPSTTLVENNVTYYVANSSSSGVCESARMSIKMEVFPTPNDPTGNLNQTFNQGAIINDLVMNETNVLWYGSFDDAINGTNSPSWNDLLETKKYYAVVINDGGCRSNPVEVNVTVGVLATSNNNKNQLTIYPVPFKDQLNLKNDAIISNVSIFDASGKLISEAHYNTKEVILNTSKLLPGSYVIKMKSGNNEIIRKVIKK